MPRGIKKPKVCKTPGCSNELDQPSRGRTRLYCETCADRRKSKKDKERMQQNRMLMKQGVFPYGYQEEQLDKLFDGFKKDYYRDIQEKSVTVMQKLALSSTPGYRDIDLSKKWTEKELLEIIDRRVYQLLKVLITHQKLK